MNTKGLLETLWTFWNHMQFYLYNFEKDYMLSVFFLWRQSNFLFSLFVTKKVFFLKQKTLWRHHLSKDNDNTENKDNILQIDSDLVVFIFNLESSIIRNKIIQKWNVFFFKEEYILSLYLKVKYENFCM